MRPRELKFASAMVVASIVLSFMSYKILLVGSYLAGIEALTFVVLMVILASLVLHVRYSRSIAPTVNPVSVEMGSGTSVSSGDAILFPAVAGSFAVVVLFAVIVSGELQKQVTPHVASTCLRTGDRPALFYC